MSDRRHRRWAFLAVLLGVSLCAWGQWPYPTPEGQLRLMSWNIEFLNVRTPPRTPEQLNLLGQRIAGFDTAILALQEITQITVLQDIASALGPNWRVLSTPGQENALLYDEQKVALVSGGTLTTLTGAPFTTYPGASHRRPISGIFEPVGGGEAFRVVGVHCHWSSEPAKVAEGQWLRDQTVQYLSTPGQPEDIFVLGDYNGEPGWPPHPTLLQGGQLTLLPKGNPPPWTGVLWDGEIDHCAATQGALSRLPVQSALVVKSSDYGETPEQFEAGYSDHYPIVVDLLVPEPMTTSLLVAGLLALCVRRRRRNAR